MTNSADTDKKLDQLIQSINTLAYIIERRGRTDSTTPHSDDTFYYRGIRQDKQNDFLRNLGGFNNTDFVNLMDEAMKDLEKQAEAATKLREEIEQQLKDTTLTTEQRRKLNDDLNEAIDKEIELQAAQNNTLKEEFKRRQKIEEEKLRKEYQSFTDEKKALYENEDNYVNYKIGQADFAGATANRNEASRMIAESGFGNTAVGRYAQTIIGRQQRFDNIANFGDNLQTGGAAQIAQALGGGKMMTGMLGGFGKGLSSVTKFLRPFGQGLQIGIDAVKLFAQVVGAANAYITKLVNLQTDLNEMSFQKSVDINNLINERQVEAAKYIGDLHLKQVEIEGQNLLQAVDIATKQFVKATEIAVGPLTKGINETAYDAANAYLDYQAEQSKFGLERGQREKQYEYFQSKRGIEYNNFQNISSREEERVEGKYDYDSMLKVLEGSWEAQNNWKGRLADWIVGRNDLEEKSMTQQKLPNGTNSDNIGSVYNRNKSKFEKLDGLYQNWILDYFGAGLKDKGVAIAKNQWQPELFGVEWNKQQAQWYANTTNTIANIQEQAANKEIEIATEVAKKYIDASTEAKKNWLQLAQHTEKWLDEFDQVTNDLGISLGFTSREGVDKFQDTMFEASIVAAKFGKSFKEVAKIQQDYAESTGRNRMFGEHDYGQMMGLGKYLGDEGLAASYASEMEIFNVGVADSVDMLDSALQDVNRMGLNGRKYTKTLVDNLKLAQKFQFKEGTKSLRNMAKWAENTRFNLSSLGGMLDKIQEGGLENVITMGAQFQVLGGHAAMNADPIAMMYEAFADPEALMKRYQDMTKGYGQIDKETGETKFSGNEIMMMRQLAKIQGRSVEEVENEVRARNKREVVAKQLRGNFDEDQQAFISNNATYDKETGQFKVKVMGSDGKYHDKEVSQITEADLKDMMPEKHEERMENYMSKVLDYLAILTGEENLQKTQLGQATNDERRESYMQRLDTAHQNFVDNFETYVNNAKEGMNLANEKFRDYIQMWQDNNDAQGPGLDQINAATSNIVSALGDTASVIATANQKIAESIDRAKFASNGVTGKDENDFNLNIANSGGKIPTPTSSPKPVWMLQDGIVTNNNKPIVSQVTNVTKINDGLVQSNPKDVAIFAKEGGVIGNFLSDLYSDVHSSMGGSLQLDTVNVQISGSLDLSSGGQSVDIINELQNNPILLRSLSRMLAQHISSAMNGGRGNTNLSFGSI